MGSQKLSRRRQKKPNDFEVVMREGTVYNWAEHDTRHSDLIPRHKWKHALPPHPQSSHPTLALDLINILLSEWTNRVGVGGRLMNNSHGFWMGCPTNSYRCDGQVSTDFMGGEFTWSFLIHITVQICVHKYGVCKMFQDPEQYALTNHSKTWGI